MKRFVYSLMVACLVNTTAVAQTQHRQTIGINRNQPIEFAFNGAGTSPCSQVSQFMALPNSKFQVEQWLHGYIASYNQYSYPWNRVAPPTADVMLNYVDKWCKSNQQERLLGAAGSLIQELGGVPPIFK